MVDRRIWRKRVQYLRTMSIYHRLFFLVEYDYNLYSRFCSHHNQTVTLLEPTHQPHQTTMHASPSKLSKPDRSTKTKLTCGRLSSTSDNTASVSIPRGTCEGPFNMASAGSVDHFPRANGVLETEEVYHRVSIVLQT